MQLSNITFAIGMVGYKRLMETRPMPQHNAFAWFSVGAFLVAVIPWFLLGNTQKMPQTTLQWGILVFLWRGGFRDWLLYVELQHRGTVWRPERWAL